MSINELNEYCEKNNIDKNINIVSGYWDGKQYQCLILNFPCKPFILGKNMVLLETQKVNQNDLIKEK
jgi:hypothetical protein